MAANPALDIATALDGESVLALTLGTNLFVGQQRAVSPEVPNDAVFIFSNSGLPPVRTMGETEEIRTPLVNIRVRWSSGQSGDTKIRAIMDFLQALQLSDAEYISTVMLTESEPLMLGADDQGNHLWTLGAQVTYRRAA